MMAIPQRLEHGVGETEDQEVLHRLLAQVVIDAVDLRLVEPAMHHSIERPRRLEILAERFLDDHAAPARRLVQAHLGHRAQGGRKDAGGTAR